MKKHLSTEPARELTSREISKVVMGLLGGLATWCKSEDIGAVIDFMHAHKREILQQFGYADDILRLAGIDPK